MPQFQVQPQQLQAQPKQEIPRVNGIDSARAYSVQPNSTVWLMDTQGDYFYIKSSDASGFCTLDKYAFKKVDEKENKPNYATVEQLEELKKEIMSQLKRGEKK